MYTNLPSEILKFFHLDVNDPDKAFDPRTIESFVCQRQYFETVNIIEVFKIVNRFKNEGFLISAGMDVDIATKNPMTCERLVSLNYNDAMSRYGSYNFMIQGFSSIAAHFSSSVKPIIVTKKDGSLDIGTGFLLGNCHTLITARHVIEGAELVQIPGKDGQYANAKSVSVSKNKDVDIALILIDDFAFQGIPHFNTKDAEILEDVMTIGYPPIPGFDAIQVYDTSSINNSYKFSKGQIISKDKSYFDSIDYIIINAKVKGGNSGGPVINRMGNVVGMVIQIPIDPQDSKKLDHLGYGIITPKSEIMKLLETPGYELDILKYSVENKEHGFAINFKA